MDAVVRDLTPTDEQCAIIAEVATGGGSIMAEAYAGTAKSTTIELSAPGVRVPALGMAFNKSIAIELQKRLPQNFTVKTFNGLGHGAWSRANSRVTRMELDDKKLGKLVTATAKEQGTDLSSDQWDGVRGMVSKAMLAGIVPTETEQGSGLTPDTIDNWTDIADDLFIPRDEQERSIELAREVLRRDIALARSGIISFDDQVYCSACLGGKFPLYPFVVVDEYQDINPLNIRQIDLGLRPGGRLMVVGDPLQSIYQFRGTDAAARDKLRAMKSSWSDKKLTLTFRCPKIIVERQKSHAPGFTAWHTNEQGIFGKLSQRTDGEDSGTMLDGGWDYSDLKKASDVVGPGSSIAILCRNNAPLLSLAFKFIRQGTGVKMLGREIGKGLIMLSRKIVPEDATPRDIAIGKIRDWMEQECALARANQHDEKIAGIMDRGECLIAVAENSGVSDAGSMRQVITRLFAQEVGQVTLGSVHKAKGLEWNVVVHLDPWRIPSRYAKEAAKAGDMTQLQQERNLHYVLETRSKHTLLEANLEDFNDAS